MFKDNGVPSWCSSRFYYTMFMPKGIREHLNKLLYIALFAIAVPALVLLFLWHTAFSSFNYDKKVLITIVIAAVWIVLFIVLYFNIYVRTKVRYYETIIEGRKYRNAIRKEMIRNKKQTEKQ